MSSEDKQHVAVYKAEVKELQRQHERDLKLQDFLSVKGTRMQIFDFKFIFLYVTKHVEQDNIDYLWITNERKRKENNQN